MRLVLLSEENGFSDYCAGGIGTYTRLAGTMLAEQGHEVHIITHGLKAPLPSAEVVPGLWLHLTPAAGVGRLARAEARRAFAERVRALHRLRPIDVIEAPEWLGQAADLFEDPPCATVTRLHTPLAWIERLIGNCAIFEEQARIVAAERRQVLATQLVVAPSRAMASVALDLWGVQAEVLPNVVEPPSSEHLPARATDPVVLFLGRLEVRKGVFVLADALAEALRRVPQSRAILCGRDSSYQRRSIRRQIEEKLGTVRDRVAFREHVAGSEKRELIRAARVVVVPSLWENQPYSLLEALREGTPVVASAVGGLPELVEEGENGWLVPAGRPDILAARLQEVLEGKLSLDPARIGASLARLGPRRMAPAYVAAFERARTGKLTQRELEAAL